MVQFNFRFTSPCFAHPYFSNEYDLYFHMTETLINMHFVSTSPITNAKQKASATLNTVNFPCTKKPFSNQVLPINEQKPSLLPFTVKPGGSLFPMI